MPTVTALGRRLLQLIPVLFGISIVGFLLMHLSPGDPARLLLGDKASAAAIAALRARYGLDQPLLQQYLIYMSDLFHGDMGRSILYQRPVGQLILQFMPRTLFLLGYVLVISIPTTVVLAILAARHRDRWPDKLIRGLAIVGMTIPVFWLALMMSRFFGVGLGWFPVSGFGHGFAGHLHHMLLPAVSTAVWLVPLLLRNLRATLIEQAESDYVTACRAKGLTDRYIFRRHVLVNSILPTLNLLGVMIAYLIGGSVIVEIVYAIPGMGMLLVNSVLGRDYYVVQGLTLFYALGTVLVTLTIDVLSTFVDPRVKL